MGSVQAVTPPVSRPISAVVTNTDDWKGVGVEDLNREIKRKEKEMSMKGSISASVRGSYSWNGDLEQEIINVIQKKREK